MPTATRGITCAIAVVLIIGLFGCDDEKKKEEPQEKPKIYGHDTWLACPQIKKGCGALLVDITKNNQPQDTNLSAIKDSLTKAGCTVDYVEAAKFDSNPKPKDAKKTADNQAKWADLQKQIDAHVAALKKGRELEIVMVRAHGADNLSPCGWWGPGFPADAGLDRDKLLAQIYTSANQNVCGWATYDGSCYGGLSIKAVDELENKGKATCTTAAKDSGKPGPNHPKLHAAFLSDDAASTGLAPAGTWLSGSCDDKKIKQDLDEWQKVIDKEAQKPAPPGGRDYFEMASGLRSVMQSQKSYYTDDGYNACQQATHPHQGY
jgi:hypothetical protein